MYRLSEDDARTIAQLPEAGMGYQFIETGPGRNVRYYVLLNAIFALSSDDLASPAVWSQLAAASEKEATVISALETIRGVSLSDNVEAFIGIAGVGGETAHRLLKQGRLHGSPPFARKITGPGHFYRYSAFQNDRRVTTVGGLTPGTYATSMSDTSNAQSGLAAVGRYALPNPNPAVGVFTIDPGPGVAYFCGTVLPMFGQAGGGVEVEFPSGTAPGTVKGPTPYPEI